MMIKTEYLAEILSNYDNLIFEKEYPIYTDSLNKKFIYNEVGDIVYLENIEYKEWVDEESEMYQNWLNDYLTDIMNNSERSKTGNSLREILDLDD